MTDKIPEIDNKFLNKLADSIEELHVKPTVVDK